MFIVIVIVVVLVVFVILVVVLVVVLVFARFARVFVVLGVDIVIVVACGGGVVVMGDAGDCCWLTLAELSSVLHYTVSSQFCLHMCCLFGCFAVSVA